MTLMSIPPLAMLVNACVSGLLRLAVLSLLVSLSVTLGLPFTEETFTVPTSALSDRTRTHGVLSDGRMVRILWTSVPPNVPVVLL